MFDPTYACQVMIVNVNPYDTGFDENSHVMRFSSLARDVYTAPAAAAPRALPSVKDRNRPSGVGPHRRKVTISMGGAGRKASEAHLEVLEGEHQCSGIERPLNPLIEQRMKNTTRTVMKRTTTGQSIL